MALTIKDHPGLHAEVARAALAGGAAALAGLFLPASAAAAVSVLAIGVAVVPPTSGPSAAWAILCACAGGAATRLGPTASALAMAAAIGASLSRGVVGWPRAAAFAVGIVGALTAFLIGRACAVTGALALFPSGIETLLVGALTGAVTGLSALGRHVRITSAPVEAALTELASGGEIGELFQRAAVAYREAALALGDAAPQARAAADDLVRRMARFGKVWQDVELEISRTLPDELHGRRLQLAGRLEAATDSQARADFERAHRAVEAQLGCLDEIARGRERAVARLSHQVATIERLRLAALRHRSIDAARLAAELEPMVEDLQDAGESLDLAAEALSEAQLQVAQLPARS